RMVIAEIDPTLPRTCGNTEVHIGRFDHVVDAQDPMCEYAPAPVSERSRRVAEKVIELLVPGSLLQIGIGAVTEAVVGALPASEFGRTRFVGMVTERMGELFAHGAPPSTLRAVELMGGPALMAFANDNPTVRMVGSVDVHDARKLAAEGSLTSVNSALAVDLTGQVASEAVGGRVVGGIGGSVDFFDAARMSTAGERVIALPAETPDGSSTIVRQLPPATPVTIPHHLVDVVVTEYGVARLAELSLAERADALVAIAAPRHRAALTA
ncbi:MAG: acetyl-CoA hydrolase/transferase, partial [Pseudonocardiales bacterium]|nr:acetyl-CoA hydrolase/transferase [Pseudonocardiales bacterium]